MSSILPTARPLRAHDNGQAQDHQRRFLEHLAARWWPFDGCLVIYHRTAWKMEKQAISELYAAKIVKRVKIGSAGELPGDLR